MIRLYEAMRDKAAVALKSKCSSDCLITVLKHRSTNSPTP